MERKVYGSESVANFLRTCLDYVEFVDLAFQAHRLVSALFSQDVHPGELFIEAKIKSLLAPARSPQEGFYESIIQDVRDRGELIRLSFLPPLTLSCYFLQQ